tara:strand:+ start:691 stop:981 length:291 start_codon:yes stop_codon:yes gene_type:complete
VVKEELRLGDLVKVKRTTVFFKAGALGLITGKHYRRYDSTGITCPSHPDVAPETLIVKYDVELMRNEYTKDLPGDGAVRFNEEELELISKVGGSGE